MEKALTIFFLVVSAALGFVSLLSALFWGAYHQFACAAMCAAICYLLSIELKRINNNEANK